MHCQYKSINRGPQSIFGRLRAEGITNPEEYITFYGLRNWGELDNGHLVTEQVYVHAKVTTVLAIHYTFLFMFVGGGRWEEKMNWGVLPAKN